MDDMKTAFRVFATPDRKVWMPGFISPQASLLPSINYGRACFCWQVLGNVFEQFSRPLFPRHFNSTRAIQFDPEAQAMALIYFNQPQIGEQFWNANWVDVGLFWQGVAVTN